MKLAMNAYIKSIANGNTRAVVVDAETMLSSSALLEAGVPAENIYVINYEKKIIDKAKKKGHVHSVHGISTSILPYLKGSFGIVYLDYCGTPELSITNGFSPQVDLWWAAANLAPKGRIICTFSKRCVNAMQKAKQLIPSTLKISTLVEYCETSPMFSMVLTKVGEPSCDQFFQFYSLGHKYKVGDTVGVDYTMTDGSLKEFVGEITKVTKYGKKYKYLIEWENDKPTYEKEESISRKLYCL